MAKAYASKPSVEDKLKKKLWLKIAKHILKKDHAFAGESQKLKAKRDARDVTKDDVDKALRLLKEAHGVLKIDDLLQYFPDQAKVETLKDELCKCLDEYNERIQKLKEDLQEHSRNAEVLRQNTRKQKHKFIMVHPTQHCDLCFAGLLSKEFYVFPCLHGFHRECLLRVLKHYQTKDFKVASMLELVKSLDGNIEAIRSRAALLAQESGELPPSAFGELDEKRKSSWFSGLASMIRNSFAPNKNLLAEAQKRLSPEDENTVKELYVGPRARPGHVGEDRSASERGVLPVRHDAARHAGQRPRDWRRRPGQDRVLHLGQGRLGNRVRLYSISSLARISSYWDSNIIILGFF